MRAETTHEPIQILMLEGDGIGPEIMSATREVLRTVDRVWALNLDLVDAQIGFRALHDVGTTLPDDVVARARAAHGTILGPVSTNDYPAVSVGGLNPSAELRIGLELFANIRPSRTYPGCPPRCGSPVDLVVVRENTEGFYADRSMFLGHGEFMPTEDVALAVRKVTRVASVRILDTAFQLARSRRKQVTVVHKANVLRVSDGLFLECARAAAERNPDVSYEERLVDAMAALLVRNASQFDVVVTTNMYGDILSDLAAEIAGGLGMAGSLNAGSVHAVAQAQHGSAPDIAGRDTANPTSLVLSAAMLLRWLGQRREEPRFEHAAQAIEASVATAVSTTETRTADLGGSMGTKAYTALLVELINPDR